MRLRVPAATEDIVTVEPAAGAVELMLTGAPGVREFLSTWLAR